MSELSPNHIQFDQTVFQKIFDKINTLIFLIDTSGKVLKSNFYAKKMVNIKSLLPKKDWEKVERVIQSGLIETDPHIEIETELIIDSDKTWHSCRIGCLERCAEDEAVFFIAFNSIQAQKLREESLINAKERAESQEKIKSSFIANMSHEIRTPMNSIIGFSDLIGRTDNQEEQSQYLEIIKSSGRFLLNIINDVIDISQIESGFLHIKAQRVNINYLINELADIYRSDARLDKQNVEIITMMPLEDKKALILTDKTRIRQILSNLLDNAVKFTKKGNIEFGYKLIKKKENEGFPLIRFHVKDTGIGIPEPEQELIFDRFHQVREGDQSIGSGLGLAIVKALVEKLGGSLSLVSKNGIGSEFSFIIPYLQPNTQEPDTRESMMRGAIPDLKGRHILIAEDIDENYKLVSSALKKSSVKLTWAKNGKEAVEAVIRDEHFDLVLMDLSMPIMDGYKATEHIKALQPKLPIIALTAHVVDGDMEKAFEAGCDDYIKKPLDILSFYRKLNFHLNM